jgi:hypothetical protein
MAVGRRDPGRDQESLEGFFGSLPCQIAGL